MSKRVVTLLLALALFFTALGTCALAEEEPAHIVVTYLTLGVTPTDLEMVQDAVNARTIPEIGVEVEFRAVSAYDAFVLFPTWLSTGESIDLMMPLLQDLRVYVNQSLLMPLDELIEDNAPNLTALDAESQPIISNNVFNGATYAIATVPNVYGQGGGFIVAEEYVTEAGFEYDEKTVYTYDDLTELFAAIKELHPDMYPCGVVTTGKTNSEFGYVSGPIDTIAGAPSCTGVLMGTGSTTIVDMFETEEYLDYITHLREWYKLGYIHPDAATMDGTVDSLKLAGVCAGYFMVSAPVQRKEGDIIIRLSEPYQKSGASGGWVVPATAKEPAAAIRFVDLVWSDGDLANLIQWGIEGVHFTVVNPETNYITFADGVDSATSGYYNTLGLWGDARCIYTFSPNSSQADNDAYTEEASHNKTQGSGILYDMSAVQNEIAAVSAVVAQYIPSLESGSVDIDTYYPQFISALKAAGIDAIIADKQAQFDAQY